MRGAPARPIVIAAGGTGGHFFPAEALAAELVQRGQRIALMTDARSSGFSSAVFEGRERFMLRGAGVFGRGALRGVQAMGALALGAIQARAILSRLDAAAVVGFGGYPAFAPVMGSRLLARRPAVVLHEQNGVLGRANRFLARFADTLALSQDNTRRVPPDVHSVVTGNPVRAAIAALAGQGYAAPADEIRLLILGGSLGARVFSDVVPASLAVLPDAIRARLVVTQQCRPEDLERVRAAYATAGINATLASFFPAVSELLSACHLVISRAGATTVAELAVIGRPAILVPLPGAIDDDQTANARTLTDIGGGWLCRQADLTPATLSARLEELITTPTLLADAAMRAASRGHPDAVAKLADLVEAKIKQDHVP